MPRPESAAGQTVYPRIAHEAGLTVATGFPTVHRDDPTPITSSTRSRPGVARSRR